MHQVRYFYFMTVCAMILLQNTMHSMEVEQNSWLWENLFQDNGKEENQALSDIKSFSDILRNIAWKPTVLLSEQVVSSISEYYKNNPQECSKEIVCVIRYCFDQTPYNKNLLMLLKLLVQHDPEQVKTLIVHDNFCKNLKSLWYKLDNDDTRGTFIALLYSMYNDVSPLVIGFFAHRLWDELDERLLQPAIDLLKACFNDPKIDLALRGFAADQLVHYKVVLTPEEISEKECYKYPIEYIEYFASHDDMKKFRRLLALYLEAGTNFPVPDYCNTPRYFHLLGFHWNINPIRFYTLMQSAPLINRHASLDIKKVMYGKIIENDTYDIALRCQVLLTAVSELGIKRAKSFNIEDPLVNKLHQSLMILFDNDQTLESRLCAQNTINTELNITHELLLTNYQKWCRNDIVTVKEDDKTLKNHIFEAGCIHNCNKLEPIFNINT